MVVFLALFLVLIMSPPGFRCAEDSNPMPESPLSVEDSCAFMFCETPNWKQDNCCAGYVCIAPPFYDPIQKPRCTNKRFLPGFGYNFGYELLGLNSTQIPSG